MACCLFQIWWEFNVMNSNMAEILTPALNWPFLLLLSWLLNSNASYCCILLYLTVARILLTSSSAIAERPHDACSSSNHKPVKNCVCWLVQQNSRGKRNCKIFHYSWLLYCFCYLIRIRHCWQKCVESVILRGWITSRLNFRLKGYISCWSLWTVR